MKKFLYYAPFLITIFFLWHHAFGPRMTDNEGLGTEGPNFTRFARDFFGEWEKNPPLDYYVNRLLPSLVIFSASRALGTELETVAEIYTGFLIFNTVMILWRDSDRNVF